ncbi:MAG: hypothetical protein CMJ78_21790 [Planctomycetaceae bacterium]|nr:hypothetical protein [Planctomycetaceae bacterium]
MRDWRLFVGCVTVVSLLCGNAMAAETPSLLERDVLPILTKNCLGCHGGLVKEGKLDLRTVPAMLQGGESGPAIEAGDSAKSQLWQRIQSDEMPAGDDREKLSAREKVIIKAWIDGGLPTVSEQQTNVDTLLPAGTRHDAGEVASAVDRHLESFLKTSELTASSLTDDEEFLRRVYLDLIGRVPTAEQAAAFLDNTKPERRAELIDSLLASPDFGQQFGRTWREWVCPPELPSDGNAGTQPYSEARTFGDWMGKKVAANEPWDKITREILTASGEIKNSPQIIFFGLAGKGGSISADGTSRAVASLFMGVQIQCARCHDDPYRDWAQSEYWGLAAFFGRSQGNFKKIEIGKGPSKDPGKIGIPGSAFRNAGMTIDASFLRTKESKPFDAKAAKDLRTPFVDWLVDKDNAYFARSFVNRTWFYLFSRGIVNPIDDFRELNPPSHPGLLQLLANEFAASNYDIKHLYRCLCRSNAYQRSTRVSPGIDQPARDALTTAFGRMPMRLLNADMLYESLKQVYADSKLDLRTSSKDSSVGMAAPVRDQWLEFHRRFGTNEDDATDFTHGVATMLTMINHPRLLAGSSALDKYLQANKEHSPQQVVEWLYLSTLSRRPTQQERDEATVFLAEVNDSQEAYKGLLWTLVNRTEFILIR